MAKVYVNLLGDDGLELVATIARSGSDAPAVPRASSWTAEVANKIVAADAATFTHAAPMEQAGEGGARVFRNRIKLPPTGGNEYTVKVKKENRGLGSKQADSVATPASDAAAAATGVKEIKLQAVRKLWFGLAYMSDLLPYYTVLKDNLGAMFAGTGIELEGPSRANVTIDNANAIEGREIAAKAAAQEAKPGDRDAKHGRWMRITLVKRILNDLGSLNNDLAEITRADDARVVRSAEKWGFKIALKKNGKPHFTEDDALDKLEISFATPPAPVKLAPADYTLTPEGSGLTMRLTHAGALALIKKRIGPCMSGTVRVVVEGDAKPYREALLFENRIKPAGEHAVDIELLFGWGVNVAPGKVKSVELIFPLKASPKAGDVAGFTWVLDADRQSLVATVHDAQTNALIKEGLDTHKGTLGAMNVHYEGTTHTMLAGLTTGGNVSIAVENVKDRIRKVAPTLTAQELQDRTAQALLRVIAHEICHAIGGPRAEVRALKHSLWYASTQGGLATDPVGHCRTNAQLTDASTLENHTDEERQRIFEPKKAKIYVPEDGRVPCIMFHHMWSRTMHQAQFCNDCLKQLRAFPMDVARLAEGPHKMGTVT